MDPVGGLVAGSLETVALDEGLDEDGSKHEAFSPVVLDAAFGQSEEMGGEVLGSDPGEDEEAGVVDDEGEARLSLVVGPYDEGILGATFQAEAAKPRQATGVSPERGSSGSGLREGACGRGSYSAV